MNDINSIEEKTQEEFMHNLRDSVENLCEKANHKSYNPTIKEKEDFRVIVTIIKNMENWF